MDELPADLRAVLLNHPFLQLTEEKKIKCSLNGHEVPCNLSELQKFVRGKKYETLSAAAEFNYSQYEPHIVPSTKQPKQLFCKLTLRHLNRQPHHVLRHVNGKRFKKALAKYEECVKRGVDFVPARLKQKRPKEPMEVCERGRSSRQVNGVWAPPSSDDDQSDSDDSMSDLYPPSMFTLKEPTEGTRGEEEEEEEEEEEDDFQTDEEMEVEAEQQAAQKRKKAQAAGSVQKKTRSSRWDRRRAKLGKVRNGK